MLIIINKYMLIELVDYLFEIWGSVDLDTKEKFVEEWCKNINENPDIYTQVEMILENLEIKNRGMVS